MKKIVVGLLESVVTGILVVMVNLVMSFLIYLMFLYLILPILCDFIPSVNAFFQNSVLHNDMTIYNTINGICCCLALVPTYILVYRFHVKRNKKFIRETEGRISPKESLKYHVQNYMTIEIGTAVVVVLITIINALIVSSPFQMAGDIIFETIGILGGICISSAYIVISQIVGIYRTMNYWKAISYIDD